MVIISDIVNVRKRAASLDVSDQFDTYTKVVINISDKSYVSAGTDGGLTLTIDNPLGTQQMANDILYKLRGYRYQPFEAKTVLADPAAEIGDGLSVNNVYGGIYQNDLSFSRLMAADISAPQDNEVDHEFKYQPQTERKFSREIGDVKATLLLQSDMIAAKVDNTSAGQDFGWELLSDHWSVTSGGREIFRVDENGGSFDGEVSATTGQIGGFTIKASAIYSNLSEFGGSQSNGVYIGTNGIQLGQAFKVTSSGQVTATNISANNMTLTGTLNIGGSTITAAALRSGAQSAFTNGSYWTSGSGYGFNFNNATINGTGSYPAYFTAKVLNNTSYYMKFNGRSLALQYIVINGTGYYVLGYKG